MRIKRSTFDLWKKRLMVFLGVCFLSSLLYIYFATSLFVITSYELVGVPEVYKATIISNLSVISSKKILTILPANRILGYRSSEMKHSVVSVLPDTMKITLVPVGLHTIRIHVVPYEPLFRIDETHAITKDGVIYNEFKDMSGLVTLTLATSSIRQESTYDGITSVSVVGVDDIKLASVYSLLTKINSIVFLVKKIDIDTYGDISFYDERNMSRVTFSGEQDTEKVWSNIVSAIDTEPLKSKLATHKDELEYLDVRFGNKVFYKFTNDTKTAIIQSHATTTEATTTLR